jgi:hypothetical protein
VPVGRSRAPRDGERRLLTRATRGQEAHGEAEDQLDDPDHEQVVAEERVETAEKVGVQRVDEEHFRAEQPAGDAPSPRVVDVVIELEVVEQGRSAKRRQVRDAERRPEDEHGDEEPRRGEGARCGRDGGRGRAGTCARAGGAIAWAAGWRAAAAHARDDGTECSRCAIRHRPRLPGAGDAPRLASPGRPVLCERR